MACLIYFLQWCSGSTRAEGRGGRSNRHGGCLARAECTVAYSTLGKALTSDESLVAGKSEIGQGLGPISEIYANGGGAKLTGFLEAFRLIFGLLAQLVEHSTVNRRAIGSSPIQAAICE